MMNKTHLEKLQLSVESMIDIELKYNCIITNKEEILGTVDDDL